MGQRCSKDRSLRNRDSHDEGSSSEMYSYHDDEDHAARGGDFGLDSLPALPSSGTNNRAAAGENSSSTFHSAVEYSGGRNNKNSKKSSKKQDNLRQSNYNQIHIQVSEQLKEYEEQNQEKQLLSNAYQPMGVVGLQNLGNTCFLNSSIQCLSATIPLTDYFLGYDYKQEINTKNFLGTGGKLAMAYAQLLKDMWLGNKSVVKPVQFKKQLSKFAPQFSGTYQHDAQELLSFLLDGIHEDLNRVKDKPYVEDKDCGGTRDEEDAIDAWKNYLRRNKSLIVDLFQGQLRNTCRCNTCGHKNIRFEPFMYLSLPISDSCRTLQDCLNLYISTDELSGDDQWYCEKCKKHRDATKKIDLWIVPPILIVHLKRFKYNEYGHVGSKNKADIRFPLEDWDLSRFVKSKGSVTPVYDLYALSNHIGSLRSGHYTAFSLTRFDEQWVEFNDSYPRPIGPDIVESATSSAYVLFYNRSEGADAPVGSEDVKSARYPMVRRQSVTRPDLWPHTQVENNQFRDYTRRHSGMQNSQRSLGDNSFRTPPASPFGTPNNTRRAVTPSSTRAAPIPPIPPPSDGPRRRVAETSARQKSKSPSGHRPKGAPRSASSKDSGAQPVQKRERAPRKRTTRSGRKGVMNM